MMRYERSRRRPIAAVCSAAAVIAVGLTRVTLAEQHTFELNAPAAQHVYLAGEMTQWDKGKLPMLREGDGMWRDADQWLKTGKVNRYMDNLIRSWPTSLVALDRAGGTQRWAAAGALL